MLSAESEADLEDWMDKLTRVIHADKPQDESRIERGVCVCACNEKLCVLIVLCIFSLLE